MTSTDSPSPTPAPAEAAAPKDPAAPLPKRTWWHRHLDPEERRRVMNDLAIIKRDHWGFRFTVMLTLSVVVAVMGLSANSAAVVIGAMLLAPLMSPVLATAGCISMALFKKATSNFAWVVAASAWSILLAYALAAILPNGSGLGTEITGRTAPDIRDLIVALGAGTAGAYATVRKDASAALPGVAVAVALVPPLGTVGITLEAGNMTFARGALLLYITNLAAIILAGVVVFVVTGFVPPRRLANTSGRLVAAAVLTAAVVVAIAIPLYRASRNAVAASDDQIAASDIVESWLAGAELARSPEVEFDDGRVFVVVRSFDAPLDADTLRNDLQRVFGDSLLVSVEWDRVERATTTTTEAPTTTVLTDEELLLSRATPIVEQWLSDHDPTDRVERVTISGRELLIDASGTGNPPSLSDLVGRLDDGLGESLEVRLTWVEREDVQDEEEPTPVEILAQQLQITTEVWAEGNDVIVESFSYDGETVEFELIGVEAPDTNDLVLELQSIIGNPDDPEEPSDTPVLVYFVQRQILITTTTTTAPEFAVTTTTEG
ncbi:MAG: DUF389 domain-containing protein [Acidimicrobiales bacterium]